MENSDIPRAFRVDRGARGVQADVEEEMEFHLARRAEELVARGVPAHLAREEALRAFGDVAVVRRELTRLGAARATKRRRLEWLSGFAGDFRLAVRSLRREPVFAAMALLTLAIGIGATTAVFSVVDGVLLRPLPYPDPARLVHLQELSASGTAMDFPAANFHELRSRARGMARMAIYGGGPTTVLGADEPLRAQAYAVSDGFFDVLGVRAALGRTFTPDEGTAAGPPAAVVSHALWQRALGGDPRFGERALRVDGKTFRVVGVMPDGFAFPAGAELWFSHHDDNPHRTAHNWTAVGRVGRGRTVDAERAELGAIMRDIKAREGEGSDAVGVYARELHDELSASSRPSLLLLQGAVAFVLLLACVNLANASLARGEARQRELAVRAALGAGRTRLARLLLAESLLLAAGGGALGLALAWALTRLASAGVGSSLPGFAALRVDGTVVAFTLGVALATGLAVGLLPAWHAARTDLRAAMSEGGHATVGRGRLRLRAVLVASEVALALALLVGAGLLVRSMRALLAVQPGFDAARVVTADVSLPEERYPDTTRIAAFYDRLLPKLAAMPGVETVGAVNVAPLGEFDPTSQFYVDGGDALVGSASYRVVSLDYFRAMGIPLRAGRALAPTDRAGAPHAIVISETAARRFWPDGSALGRRVRFPGMDSHGGEWLTVVGVVGDVRQRALDAEPHPTMYVGYAQRPERLGTATLVVRAAGASPDLLAPALRGAVRAEDPSVPVALSSMRAAVDRSVAARRFTTAVLAGFGALALLLAAVGIYGVLAYSVAQRRRELSVRMVLGGLPSDLRRMVVRDAMRAVLPGMLAGAVGALLAVRMMRTLVYGVSPTDPVSFAVVAALLLGVALLASWLPAHRATRVDPLLAVRGE